MKTIYMATTEIAADRSAAEIQVSLVSAGARKIMLEYEGGEIMAVNFTLEVHGAEHPFRLPARVDAVFRLLQRQRKSWARNAAALRDLAQAKRTAWRQILRWVQAQLAIIETEQVTASEAFFPYLLVQDGQTIFERVRDHGFKALPAPAGNGAARTVEVIEA